MKCMVKSFGVSGEVEDEWILEEKSKFFIWIFIKIESIFIFLQFSFYSILRLIQPHALPLIQFLTLHCQEFFLVCFFVIYNHAGRKKYLLTVNKYLWIDIFIWNLLDRYWKNIVRELS